MIPLGASGGVGSIGGYSFLSREITESFGVVRVADFPDVRVLHDNQVVARTDARGYAVLPRLRAYDRNPIAIDQRDLVAIVSTVAPEEFGGAGVWAGFGPREQPPAKVE